MATDTENLLAECGLIHHCDWLTFFTLVKLNPGKDTAMFYQHLHDEWRKLTSPPSGSYGQTLRLLIAGTTLGSADLVVVWQAENLDAAKAFTETVLVSDACATHSSNTLPCVKRWVHHAGDHKHVGTHP